MRCMYRKLTMSLVSTVPKRTTWRTSEVIHVECSTVANANIYWPSASVAAPVEANLSGHHSFFLLGMFAIKPSCCVRSAVLFGDWGGRHSGSCGTLKTIPLCNIGKVVSVTLNCSSVAKTGRAISSVKWSVTWTFRRIWKKSFCFSLGGKGKPTN